MLARPQVLTNRGTGRGSVDEGINNSASESGKVFSGAVLGLGCGKASGFQRRTKADTATTFSQSM